LIRLDWKRIEKVYAMSVICRTEEVGLIRMLAAPGTVGELQSIAFSSHTLSGASSTISSNQTYYPHLVTLKCEHE
jgi:hypothetical protein